MPQEPKLYIIGTPIGNLEDITLRALKVLEEIDFLICEDTRRTLKLLNRYGIKKRLISFFKGAPPERVEKIIDELKKGRVGGFVTDAGTPVVSDPGFEIIRECVKHGIPVEPVPGVSALTTLISVSHHNIKDFYFAGFPPSKKKDILNWISNFLQKGCPVVFFVSSHDVKKIFETITKEGDFDVIIGRELTKMNEEIFRGKLSEFDFATVRGEFTVLLINEEKNDQEIPSNFEDKLEFLKEFNLSDSDRVKIVSKLMNVSRKKVYNFLKNRNKI